jgi:hypothetical protein
MDEPSRIKKFRLNLARQIPRFPNNRASLGALEAKSLGALLVDYVNWKIRYIAPRPRKVFVEPMASIDRRWACLSYKIERLLGSVDSGEDLTPFLSLKPHTRGFTPAASSSGSNVNRWADKDMLLNVMGYHHLHFDPSPSNQMRSDDVLFAHVTRDVFTAIGIFNHTVFEATTRPNAAITAERDRLWRIFEIRSVRGAPPEAVVVPTLLATSGHSFVFTQLAMEYARLVAKVDPELDNWTYVKGLYEYAELSVPRTLRLKWHMHFLDLGLFDEKVGAFFPFRNGPN